MYSVMRYSLEQGRSTAELYDTFDCSQGQANEIARVLRGMKDGFWYYAAQGEPTSPKWHEDGLGPHYYTTIHAKVEDNEISSAVTALLAK